jgi:hypothetical protein
LRLVDAISTPDVEMEEESPPITAVEFVDEPICIVMLSSSWEEIFLMGLRSVFQRAVVGFRVVVCGSFEDEQQEGEFASEPGLHQSSD